MSTPHSTPVNPSVDSSAVKDAKDKSAAGGPSTTTATPSHPVNSPPAK